MKRNLFKASYIDTFDISRKLINKRKNFENIIGSMYMVDTYRKQSKAILTITYGIASFLNRRNGALLKFLSILPSTVRNCVFFETNRQKSMLGAKKKDIRLMMDDRKTEIYRTAIYLILLPQLDSV